MQPARAVQRHGGGQPRRAAGAGLHRDKPVRPARAEPSARRRCARTASLYVDARFSPRIVMVLMTCSRVPGPWFYLNAFAHVHYQSYPTRAITPMIICPARIQKHKIQYNAMPFSPLGIY